MNDDRNYILDRIKSRNISIDEFNFDNLKAPPLSMFLTQWDIQELNNIATSLRLSAKPEIRYKMIDNVMRNRGLVKFLSGTNRVTYRHPEFPDILFKVASDAVGIRDNPAEFYNQNLLKPFVTKIFEVSPGGVVAITERVNPITSREEFISVADDIFELITEWLIGEYVLADFGSTFFMNYGIRKGFGCVLLDYPYLYKLDGNKLYCNKPDHMSPTGKCDGIIDYDAGYNFLHCTKCGATYKAKELEQKIKNQEIINIDEGEKKMEVIIRGGSKEIKERSIKTMDTSNPAFAESLVSVGHLGEKMESAIQKAVEESAAKKVVETANIGGTDYKFEVITNKRTNNSTENHSQKETTKNEVVNNSSDYEEKEDSNKGYPAKRSGSKKADKKVVKKNAIPVAPVVVEEPVSPIEDDKVMTVNGVNAKAKVAESPISISEDTKKEFENVNMEKKASPVETIERAINNITRSMNEIEIDIVKDDIMERLFIAVASMLPNNNKSLNLLISAARDIIDADIEEGEIDDHTIMDMEVILDFAGKSIIDNSDCEAAEDNSDTITKLKESIENLDEENRNLQDSYNKAQELIKTLEEKYNKTSKDLIDSEDELSSMKSERDSLQEQFDKIESERDQLLEDKSQLVNEIEELKSNQDQKLEETTDQETDDVSFTSDNIKGIKTFSAIITDITELLPTQSESQKLIVLTDEDGKYVAVNNLMIAIDEVDGQIMDDMEFVSKEYIDDLTRISEMVMSSSNESETEEESVEELAEEYNDNSDNSEESTMDPNIELATQQFLEEEDKVEV